MAVDQSYVLSLGLGRNAIVKYRMLSVVHIFSAHFLKLLNFSSLYKVNFLHNHLSY